MNAVTLSTGAMLLRVGLALGLVFAILAAVLFLYRRASQARRGGPRPAAIELLAQRSLGPRTSLALVRVESTSLLIGVTPQQITALGQLPAPAVAATEADGAVAASDAAPPPSPRPVRAATHAPDEEAFADYLHSELGRLRGLTLRASGTNGRSRREERCGA